MILLGVDKAIRHPAHYGRVTGQRLTHNRRKCDGLAHGSFAVSAAPLMTIELHQRRVLNKRPLIRAFVFSRVSKILSPNRPPAWQLVSPFFGCDEFVIRSELGIPFDLLVAMFNKLSIVPEFLHFCLGEAT